MGYSWDLDRLPKLSLLVYSIYLLDNKATQTMQPKKNPKILQIKQMWKN